MENNQAKETTKKIVSAIVKFGSGTIINGAVKSLVVTNNPISAIAVPVTSIAIGMYVGDNVAKYTDEQIDQLFEAFSPNTNENN